MTHGGSTKIGLHWATMISAIGRRITPLGSFFCMLSLLAGVTLLAGAPVRATVTAADIAGQPAVMKVDCRNRLGIAGSSNCSSDFAYAQCVGYLKAGHWDYCVRGGEAGSQARRSTTADARAKLLGMFCTEIGANQFRCPDTDFNLSLAYGDCVAFRNGGSVTSCLRRDFLREYADRIDARLKTNAPVGYAFTLTNSAGDRIDRAWGSARKAPDAYPAPIAATSPYPIASVSKNIAAAATLRALADRGLTIDAPIWQYLPSDWSFSPAFKTITFRGLLRHRSGLYNNKGVRCDEAQRSVTYAAIKGCAESVQSTQFANSDCDKNPIANANATGCYQNLDYAFLRILVPMLDATSNAAKLAGPLNADDRAKLFATLYETYVNTNIFVPAGFTAQCRPVLGNHEPLVYGLTAPNGAGTDFGDRTLFCGSEGWVLSARQLAEYLHEVDAGNVIPRALVDSMKDNLLGWEASVVATTPFGASKRWWHGGCYNSYAECNLSTLVMSYSNGVQLAVIFNSDFPNNNRRYGDDVTNAFYDTLKP